MLSLPDIKFLVALVASVSACAGVSVCAGSLVFLMKTGGVKALVWALVLDGVLAMGVGAATAVVVTAVLVVSASSAPITSV